MTDDVSAEEILMQQRRPENPLLARARIPGETFKLPSHGLFYNNGELDDSSVGGELLVDPMVTLDEIIMKTPDKLLNGTSIVEVFRRCIPQVLKPLELWARDIDYLMICLRKVTYGDEYEIIFTHDCKDAKEHHYMISLDPMVRNVKQINPKTAKQEYKLTLPNQQTIQLVPPRYFRVLQFYQALNNQSSSMVELSNSLIASISGMISSVDGIEDAALINEWLKVISAGYVNKISAKVAEIGQWGPDTGIQIECKDCGKTVKQEISLNPLDFFS